MKKTMFRWLIALAIVVPCMVFSVAAETEGYYTYSVENDEATITSVDTSVSGDITIPSTLGGYPVTSIGNGAFSGCDSLTSVTIPDSVTSIGNGAFWNCTGLAGVTIPDSVTSIGDGAFADCSSLTGVTIPDSVTSIGVSAFRDCWALNYVTMGNGLESIGAMAFFCTPLTEVIIPASVRDIGYFAFGGCSDLVLTVAPENQTYCTVDGVLFTKDMKRLITYGTGRPDETYIIPNTVDTIDSMAFFNATYLDEVTIPAGVTDLGEAIFYNCTLKKIHLAEENTAFTMVDGALYTADMKRLAAYEGGNSRGSLHIPEGVETIDSGAFRFAALTSLCLPDSVTVWDEMCCYMPSLRSVVIGSGVEWIESWEFNGTQNLTDIYYVGTEEEWNEVFCGDASGLPPNATIHFVTREQLCTLTAEDGVALSAHCAPVGAEVSVLRADAPVGYRVADILLDGQPVEGRTFAVTGNHAVAVQFEAYGDFNPERSPVTRRSLAVWWTEHFVAPDVQPTGEWQFLDVPETDKDFRAIMLSAEMGIFAGNSNGEFVPEGTVTRAQLAAILSKTIYGPWVNADTFKGEGKYIDTAYFEGGWAEGYINMATQLGVMEGYSDGTFRPGIPATEEDVILTAAPLAKLVVHRMTVSTDGVYIDKAWGKIGETVTVTATPAEGYKVAAIYVDGVAIKGNSFVITGDHVVTASFVPKLSAPDWSARTPITRRELAIWVVDNFVDPSIQPMATESPFVDVPVTDEGFREIMICYELWLMSGYNEKIFGPDDSVNRAQLAVLLCNLHCNFDIDFGAYEDMDFYADVAEFEGGWCKGYVNWCIDQGFMIGFDDGFFYPGEAATMEDINATGLRPWWGELCTVDVTDVQNGSVSIDRTYGQNGKTVTVTATPDKGYKLARILVDGKAIAGNTFTLTGTHTVTAVFEKESIVTFGYFSLQVVNTILVDGKKVDICRWIWTPA